MAARKTPPAPTPTCPDCKLLLAELVRLQKQARKHARENAELEAVMRLRTEEVWKAQDAAGSLWKDCLWLKRKVRQQQFQMVQAKQKLAIHSVAVRSLPGEIIVLCSN